MLARIKPIYSRKGGKAQSIRPFAYLRRCANFFDRDYYSSLMPKSTVHVLLTVQIIEFVQVRKYTKEHEREN
jgi:hypothetical protein